MAGKRAVPFIVGYGEENFLLDRIINRARHWKGRYVQLFDGDDTGIEAILDECGTRSFDGVGRVVIVDNAQKLKGSELDTYIEAKSPDDIAVILVAIIRSDKLPKVWVAAGKKGRIEEARKFKPWEEAKKIDRIQTEAGHLGLTLGAGVPELLLRVLGDNLRATVNELRKLEYFVAKGETVTREHVNAIVTHVFPVDTWEVAEAAAAKSPRTAMTKLGLVLKHGGDNELVPVVYSLMRMVEKLIVTRQALDKGDSPELIAKVLGVNSYAFKKNTMPLALKHSVLSLREMMARLCTLEVQVKGSARSKRTLVELAVLSLAV